MTTTRPVPTALREEAAFFVGHRNPRIMAIWLAAALIGRVVVGGWSATDAIVIGALLAIHPFSEWVIHVFILHFRPREIRGRRIDPLIAREHRRHHIDPTNPRHIFIPLPVLLWTLPVTTALFLWLLPSLAAGLTAVVLSTAVLLIYEWTHYLIHSTYRPRSRLFRAIARAHRLHHYKNEQYWFGVTTHVGDRVLRTYPQSSEVETSPTARTLSDAAA